MTRKTLIAFGLVATTAIGGIVAIPVLAHGTGDGSWSQHMGQVDMMQMMGRMHGSTSGMMEGTMDEQFAAFDTNADGTVSPDEMRAGLQAQLDTYDTDANGTLSLDEYAKLYAEQTRAHMVDRFQALDNDGSGQVTGNEFTVPASHLSQMMNMHGGQPDGSRDEMMKDGSTLMDEG